MSVALLGLALAVCAGDAATAVSVPRVLDPRLTIELVAAEPDIVTPTGLAVDGAGRVLVVECHTHFRPPDYQGPPADRIRVFEKRGDGFECTGTFFEGTRSTMNIGVHPDGSVYVATRGEILRLRDTDGDGRSDERTPIARLETAGDYPHNGLSGFAFDVQGNVYFGLGENLGKTFRLVGTDGSVASELEGGQVYRCRADGTHVEMIAFGFWNPFHVALDAFGRLFAVDNDPDSLPPCRLMHIVQGGNYGYRYRNGRKGVHPFTAWNGELPGTLPMVSGTGEAPSGVVAYESDLLPGDYIGDLLVTSWGDHRIERHRLDPRGASFQSTPEIIVQGDENFRPVGIAVGPDGAVYLSDWVLKSYDVHGKGRIWRITAAGPVAQDRPSEPREAIRAAHRPLREEAARRLAAQGENGRAALADMAGGDPAPRVRAAAVAALADAGVFEPLRDVATSDADPGVRALAIRLLPDGQGCEESLGIGEPPEVRAEAMRHVTGTARTALLWQCVSDLDAFLAEAARVGLARTGAVTADTDLRALTPQERLAALLVLRESKDPNARRTLGQFLADPDGAVRFAAIQWVGEERLTEFREPLEQALSAGPATSRLFGGYLAALERLDGVVREPSDEWGLDQFIVRALDDPATSPEVRRWSLRMLRPDHPALSPARLRDYLAQDDPALQLEAVRTLRESPQDAGRELLAQIAADSQHSPQLRAEAIVGLTPEDGDSRRLLISLAGGDEPALRDEALRSLVGGTFSPDERQVIERLARDAESREQVARILAPEAAFSRPTADDLAGWLSLLSASPGAGDAAAGERIFFHHRAAGCSKCHQMVGRGARIGPELTTTAARLRPERLVESIVRPGKEIAPHFATWLIVTTAGKSLVGMLVDEEATGEQTYADAEGRLTRLAPTDIESRKPQTTSIMPDGLAGRLTVREFRDLLAYLQSPSAEAK